MYLVFTGASFHYREELYINDNGVNEPSTCGYLQQSDQSNRRWTEGAEVKDK